MENSLLNDGYATETKGEEWRDIAGYEGRYQVSNLGRVKSLSRITQLNGRVRKEPEVIMSFTYRSGYPNLILRKDGKKESRQVHRLVAEAFLPNPDKLPVVNHKDFDRTNNRVENLEWCTIAENVRWSKENMQKPKSKSWNTTTGEMYIRKLKNGRYRFALGGKTKKTAWTGDAYIDKTFGTLEEAVEAREKFLNELRMAR